jgi:oligopeptide/dipeptide ABC transporter ATP-binding protein
VTVADPTDESALDLADLHVDFRTEDGVVQAVRGVDLHVSPGEVVAVVGESGSGKSVTMLSVLGLHPKKRTDVRGAITWRGENLLEVDEERMRHVRGGEISMVFQDPLTALNPVHTVGKQIVEMVRLHMKVDKKAARERAIEMLDRVGIPNAATRVDNFPHEFSGGMRQRAMIAMALSCDPKLVIADEPTTALDVTVQAQVLELLVERTRAAGAAMVLITHDLGVVAGLADRVAVMYAGKVVELAVTDSLFAAPAHPYTIGLLDSLPRVDTELDERLRPIGGQPPSMLHPPSGCAFHPRCPYASVEHGCMDAVPELDGRTHAAACWRRDEVPVLRAEAVPA